MVTAWAGGVIHQRQLVHALTDLGSAEAIGTSIVVSVNDPALAKRARNLADQDISTADRHRIAASILATAKQIVQTESLAPIEVIVAVRPVTHLVERGELTLSDADALWLGVELAEAFERVGDIPGAVAEARRAISGCDSSSDSGQVGRVFALLVRHDTETGYAPELPQGALTSTEARVWQIVDCSGVPKPSKQRSQRSTGLNSHSVWRATTR